MLKQASIFALALGLVLPAHAQETVEQASASSDHGDEIIVTARKRAEALQDVPVAVSAISGLELDKRGIATARDLFAATPGLFFSQSGQRQNEEQFYLTIRGVGSSPVVEPSVGLFVDGVYIPSLGWTADFLDLERVEILRGPQGAIFGRNTEGGAVNIITRKPDDQLRGRLAVEGASFNSFKASAAVAGPLADKVFAGIAGFASTTDGYMRNDTRGEHQDNRDRFGGRFTLRALPGDTTELILSADYIRSKGRFDAYGDAVANQQVTVVDPQAPAAQRGTFSRSHALAGRRYTSFGNDENRVESRNYGFGLTLNADLGFADLTSISGYRNVRSADSYDNDGVATATSTNAATTRQSILSEELRLSGGDRFEWLAGAYGFSEKLSQDRLSRLVSGLTGGPITGDPFGFVDDRVRIKRDGLAVFGQATYHATDRLELTVGARYSYEKVDQRPNLRVRVQVPAVPPPGVVPTIVDVANNMRQKKSFEGFSPSGSISYHATDDLLLYASVATGFKSGGFTKEIPNTPLQNAALDNETSLNYELGLKGDLAGGAVRLNAALFYTEIKDQQLATRIELAPGTGVYIPSTLNVGKGHAQGFEIETTIRPTGALKFVGSLSYTKTEFDDYIASPATATAPAYDRAGQAFPEVPKWLAYAAVDYRIDLGGDVSLTPMVSWRHTGSKYVGQGNASIPFITIDSYDIFDAQIELAAGPWTVTGFVRNLSDKYYFVNRFQLQPILSAPGAATYAKPAAPRQFGVRLTREF